LKSVRKTRFGQQPVHFRHKDKPALARKVTIYLSHRYNGRALRDIGERFGIGESAVSQASGRLESLESELQKKRNLRRRIDRVRISVGLCSV
jgi:putative transposase